MGGAAYPSCRVPAGAALMTTSDQAHQDVRDHTREAKAAAKARRLVNDDKIELFWLLFEDPDKSGGDAFMGVSIVPATKDNFIEAVQVAHHYRCNPAGGQVVWIEKAHLQRLPRRFLAKLLNADEVQQCEAIIHGEVQ